MKNTFLVLSGILVLTLIGCSSKPNPYKNLELPDKTEYSKIIRAILEQDTININRGLLKSDYIALELPKLTIKFGKLTPDTFTSNTILTPPEEYLGPYTSLRELYYYDLTDSINFGIDSVYFSFLNDSTQQMHIDSNIVDFVKFATSEIKNRIKGKEYIGYFQFTLPILNKNSTKAFVSSTFVCSGLCGQGTLYILEKRNNKWIVKLAKTLWVS